MSVQGQIDRLKENVSASYAAIQEMGGTISQNANSQNLAAAINSIPAGGKVYSTQETVIGTWIDGKPIYRQVFEIGGTTETSYIAVIPDVKDVVAFGGTAKSNNLIVNLPFYVGGATRCILVYDVSDNAFKFVKSSDLSVLTAIIEYTKTTD